jgi:FkbM family methyltransferase
MRVAFLLRQWAVRRLKGRPVDTEVLGVRMRLMPHNNVCEKRILFTPQYFDAAEREFLSSLLKPGVVFLDIGSNVGGYALWAAARAGKGARILAVEPEPEVFERLCFNIGVNPTGTVKAVNTAVADINGSITLFLDRRNRGGTSVRIVKNAADGGERMDVPSVTLVDLAEGEKLERIDILKLDVEGSEDMVLGPFLREAPDALLPRTIVLNHLRAQWAEDLPKALEDRGYRSAGRTPANLLLVRD